MIFSPIKSTKVYEQVIEQIKNMIVDGTLKRGDRLPSERELVENLEVSRTSVREAIRALQIMGLIECKQGEGNFIKENFENTLLEPISIMFMLQQSDPEQILDVRKIIETETAALAAERITEEQLDELKKLTESFQVCRNENENVKFDKQFHYKIAKASANLLIVNILNAMSSLMDSFLEDARKKILIDKENVMVLANQHKLIYESIRDGNGAKASEEMRKHLEFTNEYIRRNV
ncbi:GntR family transcriptional repressor for pyruvate dehydrogenase complex [Clostridium algifaecis]|uniref:GntR family transcriptional repressor for pyruvate dehydrogenase complex n=1 Tax=Clostridium algifaecis TaxID=1472040 RepID=A0ABS4KP00_9CLOT|nr:FadR/GntR family transcriptional regulator [Clostridium algifaecis]MBP2031773.1 GntR family transcriptional repressor for pyruvate dehydrogenase complex [Clostridium algifaecis]